MDARRERNGSRRGFLKWSVALGGLLAAGVSQVSARILGGHGHQGAHGAAPFELPPFHYGPRMGEPGYDARVAELFSGKGLPRNPSSY